MNLGRGPEFLWWTDHESGDLSDWTDDSGGSTWKENNGTLAAVDLPTRSGRYAIRSEVVATNIAGATSSALVSRTAVGQSEAFYSAWFYVPETVDTTEYWLFFKFRSNSGSAVEELWDLDLEVDSASGLRVRLYHHDTGNETPLTSESTAIRIGRWFQTEAFLRTTGDSTGQLTIWIDGVMAFDVTGRDTPPPSSLEWSIGGATERITPDRASLYFDDAAITTQRLGPEFPVFWRGS